VTAFTSRESENVSKPSSSDSYSFSARIDSRGRLTVPRKLRDRFGLEQGDQVIVELSRAERKSFQVSGREEAIEVLESLDGVESFSFSGNELEVFTR
jgi:AbrB family looped-hinge helix DNA binding protein